jgi:hypothetical protein
MAVVTQIQARRGTAAQWTSANPTLAAGEWGYETDTGKVKIGNGSTVWNSLGYTGAGDIEGVTAGTGISGGGTSGTVTISIDTSVTADLTTAQTLTNKTLTAPVINLGFNAQTGTTYTFALTDNGKLVTASNASAQTYSIPTNATTAFPIGTQINIIQIGAGQVTIQAASSGTTTVSSTGATATAPKLRAQYSSATLIKANTDLWYVVGDIS